MRLYDGAGIERSSTMLLMAGIMLVLTAEMGAGARATRGLRTQPPTPSTIRFSDVSARLGVDFRHSAGRSAGHQLPETMGGGVAWIDYDNDGRQDLYFVDSGVLPGSETWGPAGAGAGRNRL